MQPVQASIEPYHLRAHNERLQSLRGLAAMAVMIAHTSFVTSHYYGLGPLVETVFQRIAAVIFFFVLSGFVLSESIRKNYPTWTVKNVASFVIRRVARLYPVLTLSVLAGSAAGWWMYGKAVPGTSGWYAGFLHVDTSPKQILLNLIGVSYSINGVLWSVQIEIVAICVLPLLMLLIDRISLAKNVLVFIVLCTLYLIIPGRSGLGSALPPCAFCFYLGAMLPYLLKNKYWQRAVSKASVIVVLAALDMILYWFFLGAFKLEYDALVSAAIISFVLLRKDTIYSTILSAKPLVWLGDISYSFYAFGQLSLAVTAFLVMPRLPLWLLNTTPGCVITSLILFGLSLCIALPLSALTYKFIELPGIAFGARIAGRKTKKGRRFSRRFRERSTVP